MPDFSIFKIFQIFGIVSTWATKAFADGVVTLSEAVELAVALCAILGIPTKLDLPTPEKPPGTDTAELNDLVDEVEHSGRDPPAKPDDD
ncbi:hypothetical protein ES703_14525 [subsurface metagenome]